MAKLSHNIVYSLALLLAWLVRRLSARAADRLGRALGSVAHALLVSRRRIATDNLRSVFHGELTEVQRAALVKKVFHNVGRTSVEVARYGHLTPAGLRELIVGDGAQILERVYAQGQGGLVITAHFGNWEYVGSWVAAMGYPMDLLVLAQHNEMFDRLLNRKRKAMGVGIVSLGQSVKNIFKALKANRFVGIAADQHDPSGNLIRDFLGRPAAAARGPAVFSLRTGAPVLPFLLRRERFDRHVMIAGEPIYPPSEGDEEKNVRSIVEKYHRFYENTIRRYPDQWLWTHRRWKV
jgi:KDO2-lipid IV(A) lauroyltransferase